MAHFIIALVLFVFSSFVVTVSDGFTAKNKSDYEPTIYDKCEGRDGGKCRDGTRLHKARKLDTSTPCGPIAIWHAVKGLCGLDAVVPYYSGSIVTFLGIHFGVGDQRMAKFLTANFKHPKNKCPKGEWRSYNASSENFIDLVDRVTRGGRYALVTTQVTISPHTLHWWVVERVEKSAGKCTVYVKDSGGRGTFTCERFRWLADHLNIFSGTPNHTIVWFSPAR